MSMMNRRDFLRSIGASAAMLPFVGALPSLAEGAAGGAARRRRLVIMTTPNGTIPPAFWPDAPGELGQLKPILSPLQCFADRMLTLQGVSNKVRGDGDGHMRGMSCLLTGIELFPGNIQGGSHTPAGWSKGISIDQAIRNHLQGRPETRTRFGSLEFGVGVPHRADPWTRMSYAGPNKPVAPVDDPYEMFEKLYGRMKDRESLGSILDDLEEDFRRVSDKVGREDRRLLEEHAALVRELERELRRDDGQSPALKPPSLEPGVANSNDNIPRLSRMQIDLMVNALANDMTRVATIQYTNSVGSAKMHWLGVDEGHHTLSHEPDSNTSAQEKLVKINTWLCAELAYFVGRLAETKEPDGNGTLLDNTLIVWTNELGKGNSHTLDNIPFVLVGDGCDFEMGRAMKFDKAAHNCLWMAVAHSFGLEVQTFGNPRLCEGGPLDLA